MRKRLLIIAVLAGLLAAASVIAWLAATPPAPPDLAEVRELAGRVRVGMTEQEAKAVLSALDAPRPGYYGVSCQNIGYDTADDGSERVSNRYWMWHDGCVGVRFDRGGRAAEVWVADPPPRVSFSDVLVDWLGW